MTLPLAPARMNAAPSTAAADLGRGRQRRVTTGWLLALSAVLVASAVAGVAVGTVTVPPGVVAGVVGHRVAGIPAEPTWSAAQENIVWLVRVPRALLAALVGGLLAIAGVALQSLVRNILAEPYLMGVSSGASAGAAFALLFGFGALGIGTATGWAAAVGLTGLALAAFAGGLLAAAATVALATIGGRITPARMILAGVTLSYGLSALTSAMVFAADDRDAARGVLFWLLGSLGQARWSVLWLPAAILAAGIAVLLLWGRRLDVVAIGDETALTLGVSPTRFRAQAFAVVAVCTGAAVAVSGPVGFVGLVVPHVARLFVGGEHRRVLPVAALLGGIVLLWADLAARTLVAPRELPLGVVTALVGAPFLVLLVRRTHARSPG